MIIKKVSINNFRSYYGNNEFEFKDGLTLIIGDNGDGKTTFFEALEWLFNTSTEDVKTSNISAKRKRELGEDEHDRVSVSIVFQHDDGDKIVEKSFRFTNINGVIKTDDFSFVGYECIGAERSRVGGRQLLDKCFDFDMRRYCLFKGENELNVFENDTALKALVAKFSDIREFDKYVDLVTVLDEKSDRAYKKELKADEKTKKRTDELDAKSERLKQLIFDTKNDLQDQQRESENFDVRLEDLEKTEEFRARYTEIKNRLAKLNEDRATAYNRSKIDYNHALLDDLWILCAFDPIIVEYQRKIGGFSRKRRRLHDAHVEERGQLIGAKKAMEKVPMELDWDIPGQDALEEMIKDHRCKVCGHEAPEGSPELEFLKNKLANYIKHLHESRQKIDEQMTEAEKPLFPFNYLNELKALSTSLGGVKEREIVQLKTVIRDTMKFKLARKEEVRKLDEQIDELENDKKNLFIQANMSESVMDTDIKNVRGFYELKKRADEQIFKLKAELEKYKGDLATLEEEYSELKPKTGMGKVYEKVHKVMAVILKTFKGAREDNLRHFIDDLTEHANVYLDKLNSGDFHGEVKIDIREDDKARIYLVSNGERIMDPNGALRTTMYMSILFAISDITTRKREEDYPLIFDAPTSSFGEIKEDLFYNIIDSINKQCIIVTKDLLERDPVTGKSRLNEQKLQNLKCSVYRIRKVDDFDSNDISTISINIERIK